MTERAKSRRLFARLCNLLTDIPCFFNEQLGKRVLFVGFLLLAFNSVSLAQSPTPWDGFVTDTHCGTHCQRTSDMVPDRACIRRCVKEGSKYGLWLGNHVYVLNPQSTAAKYAGQKVRVIGEFQKDTIEIKSITRIR